MEHQCDNIESIWEPDLTEVTPYHQLHPGDVILVKTTNGNTKELVVGNTNLLNKTTGEPISGMMYTTPITVSNMRLHIKCWENKEIKKFIGCVK